LRRRFGDAIHVNCDIDRHDHIHLLVFNSDIRSIDTLLFVHVGPILSLGWVISYMWFCFGMCSLENGKKCSVRTRSILSGKCFCLAIFFFAGGWLGFRTGNLLHVLPSILCQALFFKYPARMVRTMQNGLRLRLRFVQQQPQPPQPHGGAHRIRFVVHRRRDA
jgi:hypothetical protein